MITVQQRDKNLQGETMNGQVLELENVTKRFGDFTAVLDVSLLDVRPCIGYLPEEPGDLRHRAPAAGEAAIQYGSTNITVDNLPDIIHRGLSYGIRHRLYVARGVDVASVREIEATRVRFGRADA